MALFTLVSEALDLILGVVVVMVSGWIVGAALLIGLLQLSAKPKTTGSALERAEQVQQKRFGWKDFLGFYFVWGSAIAITVLIFGQGSFFAGEDAYRLSKEYARLSSAFAVTGLNPFWNALGSLTAALVWLVAGIVACVQAVKWIKSKPG